MAESEREADRQTAELDPLTELLGHVGALELQIVQLPKALALSHHGGGLVRLAIQRVGQVGGEAELELKRLHIPIVNRDFDAHNLYFDVKRSQANWAEYVLHRAGFIVTSTPIGPRNAEWAKDKGPVPAWSGAASRMRLGHGHSDARAVIIAQHEPRRGLLTRLIDWLVSGEL